MVPPRASSLLVAGKLRSRDGSFDLFKLLGDPTRLKILYALVEPGELCVCDLSAVVEDPETSVSCAWPVSCGHARTVGWPSAPSTTTTFRSYLSTATKQGVNLLAALQQLFDGNPWMLTAQAAEP